MKEFSRTNHQDTTSMRSKRLRVVRRKERPKKRHGTRFSVLAERKMEREHSPLFYSTDFSRGL